MPRLRLPALFKFRRFPTLQTLLSLLAENRSLLVGISVASIFLLTMTVVATPWLLSRLPANYFCQDPQKTYGTGPLRWLWHGVLNILGTLVLLIGIAMMFTPGPGLVVMLAGLSLIRLPIKHRLIRAVAARPGIFDMMNQLRARRQRPPFIHPVTRKSNGQESAS